MGSVYCVICFLPTSLVVHLLETERLALTLFFFQSRFGKDCKSNFIMGTIF